MAVRRGGLHLVLALALAGGAAAEFETRRLVAPGELDRPTYLTAPPGDAQRVFITEQHTGAIRILNRADASLEPTPFLTVAGVSPGNEQGLLGLAFHPDYAQNGLFYVNYTDAGGDTVVAEYSVSANPNVANSLETTILQISQPQTNHNGGWIGFGPDDGFLYIASGDGGSANDSGGGHTAGVGNAQDITGNLLGKMLRIDVDHDDFPADPDRNYAIPATNPFVGVVGDDEIWSFGLRNPFRASFDRATGELYIGDVGQNNREEIDVQPALEGGHDFGWRLREGVIATPTPVGNPVGGARPPGALDPIFDYTHSAAAFSGCSVAGGYVYRGPVAELQGRYFFSDFCTSELWSLVFDGSDPADFDGMNFTDLTDHSGDPAFTPDQGSFQRLSSFGEDAAGNLYVLNLGPAGVPNGGEVFVVPEPSLLELQLTGLATFAIVAACARRQRLRALRSRR